MITDALVLFLHNHDELRAIQGSRLYPIRLPQEIQLPASTYRRVDAPRSLNQSGGELARPRYQFDLYAETYLEVATLSEAFLQAIRDWRAGRRDPAPIGGPYDTDEPVELKRYRMTFDVVLWE
jgi:hypothetical protein